MGAPELTWFTLVVLSRTGKHSVWFWSVVSASFALGALFHGYRLFAADSSPAWRHALFAGINVAAAWGCWRRPPWFIGPFALLALQQLYSHGIDFAEAWPTHIDWRSLLVLLWMPTVTLALWRQRHAAPTPAR